MAHMWSTISTSVPHPQRRLWHIFWKHIYLYYTFDVHIFFLSPISHLQTRVKLLKNVTQLLTFPIIVIYGLQQLIFCIQFVPPIIQKVDCVSCLIFKDLQAKNLQNTEVNCLSFQQPTFVCKLLIYFTRTKHTLNQITKTHLKPDEFRKWFGTRVSYCLD